MLGRLRLSTKLTLIVVIGLIGTLTLGIPGAIERTDRWRNATALPGVVGTETALVRFQELVNREATLSAWFVATGEPTARRALADARPSTDRAARALGRSAPARTAPVERAWRALRIERATIDRRLISDIAGLASFDRVTESVREALDTGGAETGETIAGVGTTRVALGELDTAMAREQSALVIAIARAAISPPLADRLRVAAADQRRLRGSVLAWTRRELGPRGDAPIAAVQSALPPVRTLRTPALRGFVPFVTPEQWVQQSTKQMHALEAIGRSLDAAAATRAQARVSAARAAFVRWIALVGAVFAGVAIAGLVLRRAIRRPLQEVASAATALAAREHDLGEKSGGVTNEEPPIAPLATGTHDEVGDIARAISAVDRALVESETAPRRSLHNDLSDLYVNIARRNQPLLNRQLSLIDELGTIEHDPARLASLSQLDRLATRMHRNSESLLVLAGLDRRRTDTEPVPLLDVVRGAVSEIEEFHRVDVVGLPVDVAIVGRVAADLSHVLAEIIENATAYSPPESRVSIGAQRRPEAIELTISDGGDGLPVDQLDDLNEQLMHPPLPGFDLSRSLGLVVVARLCERIGVTVVLRSAAGTGTAAIVRVPIALVIPDHAAVDLIAAERAEASIAFEPAADPPAPAIHFAPVPPEDARGLLPNADAPPLPRREPVAGDAPPAAPLRAPASRDPGAVFELVARFEAGRRRADRNQDDAETP